MRILIVKLSSIGDIVHALPALAVVRRAIPDAHIGWAVESRSAEILRENPMIDDLIELDTKSLRGVRAPIGIRTAGTRLRDLRKLRFDVSLDMQGLLKSATIGKLSGAGTRVGFARKNLREPASRMFYDQQVEVDENSHMIEQNLEFVQAAMGIAPNAAGHEFPIATENSHVEEAREIERAAGKGGFALLNPAGGWVTKLWPAANYGALADRLWEELKITPVISVSPRETRLAAEVAATSRSGKTIIATPTLKGFFETAKRARVYVGGDTGPTHLAIAARATMVGIFGPTEWWRNGSTDPNDICVERNDIGCRIDCHRRRCSKWICMDISVDRVFEAIVQRLSKVTGQAQGI
jgi:lipopolysaccharide heptosyltransferase I